MPCSSSRPRSWWWLAALPAELVQSRPRLLLAHALLAAASGRLTEAERAFVASIAGWRAAGQPTMTAWGVYSSASADLTGLDMIVRYGSPARELRALTAERKADAIVSALPSGSCTGSPGRWPPGWPGRPGAWR